MRYSIPLLSRGTALVAQLALMALITRSLPLAEAGAYFQLLGLVLSSYFIAGLGLPDDTVRRLPPLIAAGRDVEARHILACTFTGATLVSLLIAMGFGGVIRLLFGDPTLAFWSVLWWLGYGLNFTGAQVLVALNRPNWGGFSYYAAINIALFSTIAPWLILSPDPSLATLLRIAALTCLLTGTAVLTLSLTCAITAHLPPRFKSRPKVALPTQGLLIAISRLTQTALLWTPVWTAGLVFGPAVAAQMALASRLDAAVGSILAVIRFSIRADLTRLAAQAKWQRIENRASQIAFWTSALALCAIAVTLIGGSTAITRTFGAAYLGAVPLLTLLLLGTLGDSMAGPADEVLKMARRAQDVLIAQIVALLGGMTLQIALTTPFGATGIALAAAATLIAYSAALVLQLHRRQGILIRPRLTHTAMKGAQ